LNAFLISLALVKLINQARKAHSIRIEEEKRSINEAMKLPINMTTIQFSFFNTT